EFMSSWPDPPIWTIEIEKLPPDRRSRYPHTCGRLIACEDPLRLPGRQALGSHLNRSSGHSERVGRVEQVDGLVRESVVVIAPRIGRDVHRDREGWWFGRCGWWAQSPPRPSSGEHRQNNDDPPCCERRRQRRHPMLPSKLRGVCVAETF